MTSTAPHTADVHVDIGTELLANMPPELATTVMRYNNTLTTTEGKIQHYIDHTLERKLQQWCTRVGITTPWLSINFEEYVWIDDVRAHCKVDDYPDPEYIADLDLSSGKVLTYDDANTHVLGQKNNTTYSCYFDPHLFYSRVHVLELTAKMLPTTFSEAEILQEITDMIPDIDGHKSSIEIKERIWSTKSVNRLVHDNMDISQLRRGDVIWLVYVSNTADTYVHVRRENRSVVLWNGTQVVSLDDMDCVHNNDSIEFLPREFDIAAFPTMNYFKYAIEGGDRYMWLHNNVALRESIELEGITKITREDGIVLYTTAFNFHEYYRTHKEIPCSCYFADMSAGTRDGVIVACRDYVHTLESTSRVLFVLHGVRDTE